MKTKFIQSISIKILIFYTLLALINISFIISIIFENQVELISKNSKLESERQISNLIGSLKKFSSEIKRGTLFTQDNNQKIPHQFINLIQPYASSFFIITEDNRILYKSSNDLEPPPTIAEDALRSITAENFSGKEYYLRIDDRKRLIYCYIPLHDFQLGNTILLVLKDISSLNESLRSLYYQAIYVIIVALFFHAVFALVLFKYIITPVQLLRQEAHKLAEGDFSARISLAERKDELGSLAASFNKMADAISENVHNLSGKAKRAIETKNRTDIMTVKDEHTGLFSRIYMIERINEELKRARVSKSPTALIIIDIDNFQDILNIYGKNSGDIIVLETSKSIIRSCAETDVIARFSGETFAVLSIDHSFAQVKILSETIRHEIEINTIVTPDGNFSVTASIGASFIHSGSGENPETENDLIFSAGSALALAKQNGKNRVEIIP